MNDFCLIKVNHEEKYVAAICGGSYAECKAQQAYENGVKDGLEFSYRFTAERLPREEFKIIPQSEFDEMYERLATKGVEIYEQMYA